MTNTTATTYERITVTQMVMRYEREGVFISDRTIRRQCTDGTLDAKRIGGRWFINTDKSDTPDKART